MTDLSTVTEPAVVGIYSVIPQQATTPDPEVLRQVGYPCLTRTDLRWNGHEVPYFDRATAERLLFDLTRAYEEDGDPGYSVLRREGNDYVLTTDPGTEDEYAEPVGAVVIGGVERWCIGGFAWTWERWDTLGGAA
jgi:hypothetical protein